MKVCGSIGDGEEPHNECADALQMVQVKSSVGNDPTEKMNMLIIPLHCSTMNSLFILLIES